MKTQPITEYSKKALENVGNYIELNDWEKEPVIKKVTFYNFSDLNCSVSAILQAIEIIGYQGNESDLSTCASLACIARKLLPSEEMEFLDKLIIKEERNKEDFKLINAQ